MQNTLFNDLEIEVMNQIISKVEHKKEKLNRFKANLTDLNLENGIFMNFKGLPNMVTSVTSIESQQNIESRMQMALMNYKKEVLNIRAEVYADSIKVLELSIAECIQSEWIINSILVQLPAYKTSTNDLNQNNDVSYHPRAILMRDYILNSWYKRNQKYHSVSSTSSVEHNSMEEDISKSDSSNHDIDRINSLETKLNWLIDKLQALPSNSTEKPSNSRVKNGKKDKVNLVQIHNKTKPLDAQRTVRYQEQQSDTLHQDCIKSQNLPKSQKRKSLNL